LAAKNEGGFYLTSIAANEDGSITPFVSIYLSLALCIANSFSYPDDF
jgi:hypothetical protein